MADDMAEMLAANDELIAELRELNERDLAWFYAEVAARAAEDAELVDELREMGNNAAL